MTAELMVVKRAQRLADSTGQRFCVADILGDLKVLRECDLPPESVVLESCSPVR